MQLQRMRSDAVGLKLFFPVPVALWAMGTGKGFHFRLKGGRKMAVEIALRITVDPRVRFGKPVIKGTRVPVDLIVGKLAGGMSVEEVAREYEITEEDVRAALRYAAEILSAEEVRISS
jgi:uncharacterized protein (DUF433 family)